MQDAQRRSGRLSWTCQAQLGGVDIKRLDVQPIHLDCQQRQICQPQADQTDVEQFFSDFWSIDLDLDTCSTSIAAAPGW